MNILKKAAAVALSGALVLAAATPSFAQRGRTLAAAGIGFAAGTILGAAANPYYYGYGPAYGYAPEYAYGPFAPGYAEPGYSGSYYYGSGNPYQCRVDEGYGRTSSCNVQ